MPHVQDVTWANWFGGKYGDGKKFFAQFAIDARVVPRDVSRDPDPRGPEAGVPARSARRRWSARGWCATFGWKVGDNVTLQGTIFPGDWTFTIRGIYHPTLKEYGDDSFMFHYDYLYEREPDRVTPGWFIMKIDDPNAAPTVAKTIDDQFRNSTAPTKTGTEKAFAAGFASMWGNVKLLMSTIGMAVVFAILLVTANAMMMNQRERTSEVAVMKTVGFSDRRVFGLDHHRGGGHLAHGRGARARRRDAAADRHRLRRRRLPAGLPRHRRARCSFGATVALLLDGRERDLPGVAGGEAAGRAGAAESRMKIPLVYNLRSVMQRPVSTALTALGIGLVVAVFVAMLALANGFIAALVKTGSPDNVLLLRRGADSEMSSGIPREAISIISASPHIATGVGRAAAGQPRDVHRAQHPARWAATSSTVANVVARGVSDKAFEVRRNIKVIEGRRFASGQSEICVGSKLAGRFANVNVGDVLRFANRDWNVVCRFTADGSSFESEIWGENEQFQNVFRGNALPGRRVPAQGSRRRSTRRSAPSSPTSASRSTRTASRSSTRASPSCSATSCASSRS